MKVTFVDSRNLAEAPWPDSAAGDAARRYLGPLIENGTKPFVKNVEGKVAVLISGQKVIPLLVNSGRRGMAGICSIRTHFADYPREELVRQRARLQPMLGCFLLGMDALITAGRLDEVVYVNHWMWTTDPCPALSARQLRAVTETLKKHFPDRAFVFRGITDWSVAGVEQQMKQAGYLLTRGRRVYRYGPRPKKGESLRKDMKLLRESPYKVVDLTQLSVEDAERFTQLYRRLYLEKYSGFNPEYTPAFFRLLVNSGIVDTNAIVGKDGQLVAFSSGVELPDERLWLFVAYDQGVPREHGLYRQAVAKVLGTSRELNRPVMLSAGAGYFKQSRGAFPLTEHQAVYVRHLSFRRRIAWAILATVMNTGKRIESRLVST